MDSNRELDKIDLEILIRYAVEADQLAEALAVAERFRHSRAATNLLRTYYSELPEAVEEMAVDMRVVATRQGNRLTALKTEFHHYLYLCSEEEAHYIGMFDEGLENDELLAYFGFKDSKDYAKRVPSSFDALTPISGAEKIDRSICVSCGVSSGEEHILGCPVELCPWCEAQLSRCNCRFDQLGLESFETETDIERFETLLTEKGRVVFRPEQNPSYPTAGDNSSEQSDDVLPVAGRDEPDRT